MKKIIIAIVVIIILLDISSCAVEDMENNNSIKDALKISAWVLDENFDENGYWTTTSPLQFGQWTEESGRVVEENDESSVFVFEQLKLNEVKIMNPLNWFNVKNFMNFYDVNVFIEYDGIIEVALDEGEEYMLLGYDDKNPTQPSEGGGRGSNGSIYGDFKIPTAVYAHFTPYDEYSDGRAGKNGVVSGGLIHQHRFAAKIGKEYYLNVNAYSFATDGEGAPTIRARLKFTVIEDKGLKFENYTSSSPPLKEASRFLSVELISYEYSDIAKLLDDIWDEDND